MNDLILYTLPFLAGLVLGAIFWRNKKGPFESMVMGSLMAGKKVIISIDDDAYIFEMYGNRMRITQGTTQIMEEDHGSIDLGTVSPDQSSDDSTSRH